MFNNTDNIGDETECTLPNDPIIVKKSAPNLGDSQSIYIPDIIPNEPEPHRRELETESE